jgi:hypothetical protein
MVSRIYPTGGEYREALFNTSVCFKDPMLKGSTVVTDIHGMPKPISGASASVFTAYNSSNQRWAIKCFTRFVDHQELRYQRISEALHPVGKPWQVEFDYLTEGVLCSGSWYPALKMEWVDAVGLISFIERHIWEPERVADLASKFAVMMEDLAYYGIAHGDLQHGNLLVTSAGELKLIDYDGMYVPSLAKVGACEFGHPNYQSPARTPSAWGSYLDNFSAWVIYASLVALTIDPTLWGLLHDTGDEALLFKKDDFGNQTGSRAFQVLSQSRMPDLQALGAAVKALWVPDIRTIPSLDPRTLPAPAVQSTVKTSSPQLTVVGPATAALSVPSWVAQAQATGTPPMSRSQGGGAGWIAGHLPALPLVAFQPSRVPVRFVAAFMLLVVVSSAALLGLGLVPSVVASLAVSLSLVLFVAASIAFFSRVPERQEKRLKVLILKERRSDAVRYERDISRFDHARRDVDGREQKECAKITKQAEKAKTSEQKELSDVSKRLQTQIGSLEKQRQRLASSESSEAGQALRSLQRDHVARYLSSHLVSSARIPGIGQGVVTSLATCGIRSAADFTGLAYVTGPRGGQQIHIRTPRYGLVHPSGVGERKARDLDNWRRGIEQQAMATQPAVLPPAQLQGIRMKYSQQRQALADQERAARAQTADDQRQVSAKWASVHADFSAQLSATRQNSAQERARIDSQLTLVRKQVEAALWQRGLAEREVAAYQQVSYRQYLACIIRR